VATEEFPDELATKSPGGGWISAAIAIVVFVFTAVENAWYWLSAAGSATSRSTPDLALGLFAAAAGLFPLAVGFVVWRFIARRLRVARRQRLLAGMWTASIISLLPLVIIAFVPVT